MKSTVAVTHKTNRPLQYAMKAVEELANLGAGIHRTYKDEVYYIKFTEYPKLKQLRVAWEAEDSIYMYKWNLCLDEPSREEVNEKGYKSYFYNEEDFDCLINHIQNYAAKLDSINNLEASNTLFINNQNQSTLYLPEVPSYLTEVPSATDMPAWLNHKELMEI